MTQSPLLILVRGVPGSGKTTVATQLLQARPSWKHYEIDMYLQALGDPYIFRPADLGEAERWCLARTTSDLMNGQVVVVSNDFIFAPDMYPYVELANQGLVKHIVIINCTGEYEPSSVRRTPAPNMRRLREIAERELEVVVDRFSFPIVVMPAESALELITIA